MGKLTLAVLLVLAVLCVVNIHAHWGGHGHMGRGWGRGWYFSRRSEWWDRWLRRCYCSYSRTACKVERVAKGGGQNEILKTEDCEGGATCSTRSYSHSYKNETYKFYPCTGRTDYCYPVPKWRSWMEKESGWGWGRGWWRWGGRRYTTTTAAPTPQAAPQDLNLPAAAQSAAEDYFCDDPRWFVKACKVTRTSDSKDLKDMGCARGGTCTLGPGPYTYNNTAVTASFCQNCRAIMRPSFRPWGRRPKATRGPKPTILPRVTETVPTGGGVIIP